MSLMALYQAHNNRCVNILLCLNEFLPNDVSCLIASICWEVRSDPVLVFLTCDEYDVEAAVYREWNIAKDSIPMIYQRLRLRQMRWQCIRPHEFLYRDGQKCYKIPVFLLIPGPIWDSMISLNGLMDRDDVVIYCDTFEFNVEFAPEGIKVLTGTVSGRSGCKISQFGVCWHGICGHEDCDSEIVGCAITHIPDMFPRWISKNIDDTAFIAAHNEAFIFDQEQLYITQYPRLFSLACQRITAALSEIDFDLLPHEPSVGVGSDPVIKLTNCGFVSLAADADATICSFADDISDAKSHGLNVVIIAARHLGLPVINKSMYEIAEDIRRFRDNFQQQFGSTI